jgi:hypothetical protein
MIYFAEVLNLIKVNKSDVIEFLLGFLNSKRLLSFFLMFDIYCAVMSAYSIREMRFNQMLNYRYKSNDCDLGDIINNTSCNVHMSEEIVINNYPLYVLFMLFTLFYSIIAFIRPFLMIKSTIFESDDNLWTFMKTFLTSFFIDWSYKSSKNFKIYQKYELNSNLVRSLTWLLSIMYIPFITKLDRRIVKLSSKIIVCINYKNNKCLENHDFIDYDFVISNYSVQGIIVNLQMITALLDLTLFLIWLLFCVNIDKGPVGSEALDEEREEAIKMIKFKFKTSSNKLSPDISEDMIIDKIIEMRSARFVNDFDDQSLCKYREDLLKDEYYDKIIDKLKLIPNEFIIENYSLSHLETWFDGDFFKSVYNLEGDELLKQRCKIAKKYNIQSTLATI